jgi:hypothetical protein
MTFTPSVPEQLNIPFGSTDRACAALGAQQAVDVYSIDRRVHADAVVPMLDRWASGNGDIHRVQDRIRDGDGRPALIAGKLQIVPPIDEDPVARR